MNARMMTAQSKPFLLLSGLFVVLFPAGAQVEKVAIRTTGISCGICAGLSEIYFRRVQGVEQVKISLKTEAIQLTYKRGAPFHPQEIRKILEPLGVGLVQLQISARGEVQQHDRARLFTAGKDHFVLLDAIDSPSVPLGTPVRIEGILFDTSSPMAVKVLRVKLVP